MWKMAELKILKTTSRRARRELAALRRRGGALLDAELPVEAGRLVERVRRRGDRALLKAVRRFDGVSPGSVAELRLTPGAGREELPPGFAEAFQRARAAVERYHRHQVRDGFTLEEGGVTLAERRRPLARVGVYVPGGRAAYPSTALMTVIPARLAGVGEIVVATPPAAWAASPALRWALAELEVGEVWGMGGAHAIAALAYGTESIAAVDKVVGPGNAWVTAAKQLVRGAVAIDGLAGPSEVVIVASEGADPELVAADLLAQAEHDPQALALLVTDRWKLARQVRRAVARQLPGLATAATARQALAGRGAAFLAASMEEAAEIVDALAPEHVQLVGAAAEALAERIVHAGAVFVGASTPEVFGDYVAGPSHVLPTAGTARFASALGVEDFVRRGHLVRFDAAAAARWAEAAAVFADAEGLPAHAASARRRLAAGADGEGAG
jgi:histidinol dehydrogenase